MKSFFVGVIAFVLSIFGGHQAVTHYPASAAAAAASAISTQSQQASATSPAADIAPSRADSLPAPISSTPDLSQYVTKSELDTRLSGLSAFSTSLQHLIAAYPPQAQYPAVYSFSGPSAPLSVGAFAPSQRIDRLTNTTLSNVTVNGVSGLKAGDIPDLSGTYLPLSGGTLTAGLVMTNATSTNFFATNASTTNATSTSLFASLGHFTTGIIDSLTATAATITNLIATTITGTNATFTSATTTNATSTNLYVSGTATLANLITQNTPVYDVRAYSSLQAAINAASTAGGGTVQPAPNTTYTGAVTLTANVTLRCVNRSTILTIPNTANTSVVTVTGSNTAIINCTIDGNGSNQTATSVGIGSFADISNFTVDNVELRNTYNSGLRMSGADLPPLKWSSLMYVFDRGGNGDGKEEAYG